jgi:hypothetical protein
LRRPKTVRNPSPERSADPDARLEWAPIPDVPLRFRSGVQRSQNALEPYLDKRGPADLDAVQNEWGITGGPDASVLDVARYHGQRHARYATVIAEARARGAFAVRRPSPETFRGATLT